MKLILTFLFISLLSLNGLVISESSILKDYVYAEDPHYNWTYKTSYDIGSSNVHVLELVSQQWMENFTDSSIWKHWLTICVPKTVEQQKTGLLYISGGAYNNADWSVPSSEFVAGDYGQQVCQEANAITATINQIPNQYITFDDGVARREDDIVAYSWRKYIDTQDSNWSVIKAMDAIQEFGKQNDVNIEKFIPFGASKRGWTTYGVGMVGDPRIAAIIPMVIGVPNLVEEIKVQVQCYNNWSFALEPYVNQSIPSFLDTKYFDVVTDIVDPINYLDTLEILSIEDEFFLPDSTKYYYSEIKGEKRLGLFQTDHAIVGFPGLSTEISRYFNLIVTNAERPELTWDITYSSDNNAGTIKMNIAKGTPTKIVVYSVTTVSKTSRDFRKYTCAAGCPQAFEYISQDIPLASNNSYSITINKQTDGGWTAFYFEVEFDTIATVNTELAVVPNVYPYPECPAEECASGVPEWVVNSANNIKTTKNWLALSVYSIFLILLFLF
ncbi:hypothetical protein DICPUDRAFT_154106 [Dictyostelium purpureum]|uniref:Uncharacterized protein n=1 Tax=Dictyostelium purpureum TaxID=5786 RepID=F0ZQL2_DICPU|nr:uncharacterized protein DICPUDRAFT_154106 [Dictyostelium purpureum]EGC33785.1 hypothetical protein DICPUDRAFT_154106 [Dictyostelium purpureum]|eukprot:XP_003289710.1 hypothetical protein DICPUDRAFT_154106 [Dictyostelium purpureum]